jgi:hypothetical protein
MAGTVQTQEHCPTCGGTGVWERKVQVRPCEEGLCLYVASRDGINLDELAQWIADLGGQSMEYAYGILVHVAAKGFLEVGHAESLETGERPVWLTELGRHVVHMAETSQ